MSIAPNDARAGKMVAQGPGVGDDEDLVPVKRTRRRRSTSHLKDVPDTLKVREEFKSACEAYANDLDKSQPFSKGELESHARRLLEQMEQPEKFLGFTMVLIGNFFWKRQFLSVPFERRLLLLPHCLKHAEGCPAEYDEFGLDCEKCGACSIADYKVRAEQLGYKVLVAEGSPVVLKIIVAGYVDGILGVACLNVLEKAIDKVLMTGVPSYAIPLHSGDCKNTSLDEPWVWDVLEKYEPLDEPITSSYLPLMRAADRLFHGDFERLLPRVRSQQADSDPSPLALTESIAYDWLENGGKRFRPFITLAAYNAVTDQRESAGENGNEESLGVPDAVGRVAMSIEAFHKASLVHDDIQDGDLYRYGRPTLHRSHDVATAINVGDYLIGLGYRLVNSARTEVGADVAGDILDRMSLAHVKLCEGQGAEMAWDKNSAWNIKPLDALQIYALKTSPAFEAALYAGLRLGGDVSEYEDMIPLFTRHLGVGFQILNDLKDFRGDENNKLVAGQDANSMRPTVLLAMAIESADEQQREELRDILDSEETPEVQFGRMRRLFHELGVFEKAQALVDKSRNRAEALADEVQPDSLRQLLYYLVDTVLDDDLPPIANDTNVLVSLPVTQVN